MTLQEAMEYGKNKSFEPSATFLGAKMSANDLACNEVTSLLIQHNFDGELPDLSLFPNLTSFTSTIPVDMEYIARQDLTKLKRLSLGFEYGAGTICILAPALEELSINIRKNANPQLDMFACNENSIVISNMPHLTSLALWRCTWHKVILDRLMPSVEKLVICNQDYTDFSVLKYFPNLKELTVTGCGCRDVEFAKNLRNLVKLDISYNYISDFTPLLDLPQLKEVNIRRNAANNNARLLLEKGCKVIMTDGDYSFEQFKSHLKTALWRAHRFVLRYRQQKTNRDPLMQKTINLHTEEELFLWDFKNSVKYELKAYAEESKDHFHFPVPKEKLISYVKEEYPFVDIYPVE